MKRGARFTFCLFLLFVGLLGRVPTSWAQSGQNLPDIFPYQSLHLFDQPESQLTDVDGHKFATEVLANHGVSVVEFTLPTCLACNSSTVETSELVAKFRGKVRYLSLRLDQNLKLSFKYDIPEVPAVLVFNDGRLVKRFVTFSSSQAPVLSAILASQMRPLKPALAARSAAPSSQQ